LGGRDSFELNKKKSIGKKITARSRATLGGSDFSSTLIPGRNLALEVSQQRRTSAEQTKLSSEAR